ncbi:MAG: cupin domain-containing protein [Mycobacteriaceae bacterium]
MSEMHEQAGTPRPPAGCPRLASLVPDPTIFASHDWGRAPRHTRAAELNGAASGLFSEDAVDELVAARGLRTPFLRVARDGATLGDREFTAPGGVGATISDQLSDDKLLRLFAQGSTMVLQALHRTWAPLVDFAQGLGAELGHPVQVNGYVTPAQSRGFDDHYDVHDVFVLQVAGTKHWRVRPPVHDHPLRNQPWTDHRAAVAEAATHPAQIDVVLAPGDSLYVPRGWLHSATALGGASTHLTMGIHTWTRYHLAEAVVAEAMSVLAKDSRWRQALPVGVDVGSAHQVGSDLDQVRERLREVLAGLDDDDVGERLARSSRVAQRAAPVRPLATLAAADALTATDRLVLRQHVAPRAAPWGEAGGVQVLSRAGSSVLDAAEWSAASPLLFGHQAAAVGDLGDGLARRLLVEGLAVVCPSTLPGAGAQ